MRRIISFSVCFLNYSCFADESLGAIWLIDVGVLHNAYTELSTTSLVEILRNTEVLEVLEQSLLQIGLALGIPIGAVILLVALGTPFGSKGIRDSLLRIGLDNHAGEAPLLISKTKDKNDKRIEILEFLTHGLPIKKWEDMKLGIEATLDLNIVKVETGTSKHYVLLHTIPARHSLADKINWNNKHLIKNTHDGFTLRCVVNSFTMN